MKTLHDHGVYEAVQPEFEASLEITRQALLHLNIPATEIHRFTDAVRKELYAPLYQKQSNYEILKQLQSAIHLLELNWISLPTDSPLISKTIKDLAIRNKTGVSVVGVMRNGNLHPNPNANYRFASGDLLAVMGDAQQLAAFQAFVQQETT
jgi:CPA2 family monovalent cation:H+ antiporter-2